MILGQRLLELLHKAIEISVFIKNIRFRVIAGRTTIKTLITPMLLARISRPSEGNCA
jgi:hypothetical protein